MTVYLVSCVGKKRSGPCAARGLYASPWFLKARSYVEGTREPWFILSAEYGLVHPDKMISPYERTLNTMGREERQRWAQKVRDQMDDRLPDADRVVLFAGERYREFLIRYLRNRFRSVEVPFEGLGIGRQLQAFDRLSGRGSPSLWG